MSRGVAKKVMCPMCRKGFIDLAAHYAAKHARNDRRRLAAAKAPKRDWGDAKTLRGR